MSVLPKRDRSPANRRARVRRRVCLTGSLVSISRSTSVIIENVSPDGAKLVGRNLPGSGEEVLVRASDFAVLGHVIWQDHDRRGVVFDDCGKPNAGVCLALELRDAD